VKKIREALLKKEDPQRGGESQLDRKLVATCETRSPHCKGCFKFGLLYGRRGKERDLGSGGGKDVGEGVKGNIRSRSIRKEKLRRRNDGAIDKDQCRSKEG